MAPRSWNLGESKRFRSLAAFNAGNYTIADASTARPRLVAKISPVTEIVIKKYLINTRKS